MLSHHLAAADLAAQREPDATALAHRVERVRAMATGRQPPLTAAELRLLPHLPTHFTLQQIADTLVIGRETAKSQATSIYRKLGVSSRADAVAESKRLGLLADCSVASGHKARGQRLSSARVAGSRRPRACAAYLGWGRSPTVASVFTRSGGCRAERPAPIVALAGPGLA